MNTPPIPRIAIIALFVLTAGCANPAADESAEMVPAETAADPTIEAAPDPTPTATPLQTSEPTATEEVAENCMDPEVFARLTDQTLSSTPAAPEEAAELAAALRAQDFTELPESLRSHIGTQIQRLEESGTLDAGFILQMLVGEIPITTC